MNVYELEKKRTYYINLKENLKIMLTYLTNSIESLKSASKYIDNTYSVDGISADKNRIYKIREDLKQRKTNIINSVIPAIDIEIERLRRSIEEEEAKLTAGL